MQPLKEADLYLPLKRFLETQGYEVKGEVHDCDVVALRNNEEVIVVELKLSLNIDVVLQAVARLTLTSEVYIGVPSDCKTLNRKKKRIVKLLRMLGIGLITINTKNKKEDVKVLLVPGKYKPRKSTHRQERMLREFVARVGDPNIGGASSRKGLMTAYRQKVLAIALFLEKEGPTKSSDIARELVEPKTRDILYRNVYGWFDRVSRGVYKISSRGKQEIAQWK